MADITLSSAVRSNLLNLQSTADLLGKTQERLATGLKVNSALDNPTNFFTANALESRASDLGRLLDSISSATQTLEAADNGLTGLTKLVESAQATARQALQTAATVEETTDTDATAGTVAGGTFTDVDVSDPLVAATAGTIEGTTFSEVDISGGSDEITFTIDLDGEASPTSVTIDSTAVSDYNTANGTTLDAGALSAQDVANLINDQVGVDVATVNGDGDIDLVSTTTGADSNVTVASYSATVTGGSTGVADGDQDGADASGDGITFSLAVDGGTAVDISIDDATVDAYNTAQSASLDSSALSADDIVLLINDQAGAAVASVNDDGGIDITSTTTGDDSDVTITNFASATTDGDSGLADGTNAGAAATSTTTEVVNPKRDEFVTQYNDLLGQIDALVGDAGYNGVNLLNGDTLSVLFNEDGSSSLEITGVTYDSDGLGLAEVASGDFNSDTSINSTLDDLGDAVDDLRAQASNFGSNLSVVEIRQNFTKNMINTLETGAGNLTLADSNEEAANLLALQTRQQLSSTALSLASQADQNVLRLF